MDEEQGPRSAPGPSPWEPPGHASPTRTGSSPFAPPASGQASASGPQTPERAAPPVPPPTGAPPPPLPPAPGSWAPPPFGAPTSPNRPPLPPPGPLFADDAGGGATSTDTLVDLTRIPDAPPLAPHAYPGSSFTPLPSLPAADPAPDRAVRRFGSTTVVAIAAVCALLASLVTGAAFAVFDDDGSGASGNQIASGEPLDIQALIAKAQPSVVAILTGDPTTQTVYGGAGTGVVIDAEGYILTNYHVIGGATSMQVTLNDGTEHGALLVGGFPDDDVALIKITDSPVLTPAELGSSDDARVGDDVVAIGNALNLGGPPSVTQGIISAKDRIIETPNITLFGLLQTDAAINPGNSGGPLLNAQGQVIGINTAIISDAQSIGFAIPIDSVVPLIEELKQGNGAITPDSAFLGVVTQSIDQTSREVLDQNNVSASSGAFITDVIPNSSASDGGLQPGDVITEIEGQRVESPDDVRELIRLYKAGDEVTVEYERGGRKVTTDLTLRTRADSGN